MNAIKKIKIYFLVLKILKIIISFYIKSNHNIELAKAGLCTDG